MKFNDRRKDLIHKNKIQIAQIIIPAIMYFSDIIPINKISFYTFREGFMDFNDSNQSRFAFYLKTKRAYDNNFRLLPIVSMDNRKNIPYRLGFKM
jgi:hypothetical protein